METIKIYLDNMFMNLPNNRAVMKAKEELLTIMEDKYQELKSEGKTENEAVGIVISEFGNIEELAEELGIKEDLGNFEKEEKGRYVSLDEAKEVMQGYVKFGSRIGLGVVLCICSPIVLIVLCGMFPASENIAAVIGITVLLLMIAAAVGLFIFNGMKMEKYEYLKKETLSLDYGTTQYIKNQKEAYKGNFALGITIGVILCILSVIPVILGGVFTEGTSMEDTVACICVGILLAMVSVGVYLFIYSGMRYGVFSMLLQEGDYSVEKKKNKLIDTIASIYWPVIVCIYLAWSFIAGAWGRSWIIWPIAGIAFGIIATICSAVEHEK